MIQPKVFTSIFQHVTPHHALHFRISNPVNLKPLASQPTKKICSAWCYTSLGNFQLIFTPQTLDLLNFVLSHRALSGWQPSLLPSLSLENHSLEPRWRWSFAWVPSDRSSATTKAKLVTFIQLIFILLFFFHNTFLRLQREKLLNDGAYWKPLPEGKSTV